MEKRDSIKSMFSIMEDFQRIPIEDFFVNNRITTVVKYCCSDSMKKLLTIYLCFLGIPRTLWIIFACAASINGSFVQPKHTTDKLSADCVSKLEPLLRIFLYSSYGNFGEKEI